MVNFIANFYLHVIYRSPFLFLCSLFSFSPLLISLLQSGTLDIGIGLHRVCDTSFITTNTNIARLSVGFRLALGQF